MRTGKTYMRGAVFLAKEWLPFNRGIHVSNMPLKPDALAEYCKRHYGRDCEAESRVVRIPDEMLARWRRFAEKEKDDKGKDTGNLLYMDGPWDEFGPGKRWPLSGTHIAIDEAHLYIPRAENLEKRRRWRDWLREIGHHGATVEFITQNLEALDKDVEKISELRYTISSRVSDLDPFLRIPMADWYELKGGLCGEWRPWIQQFEKRREDKGWSNIGKKMAELTPEYFALYESFSRPQTEAEDGDGAEAVHQVEHEFQRRSFPGLLLWFGKRYVERLAAACLVAAFGVWLCFFGGIPIVLAWFLGFVGSFTGKHAAADASPGAKVEQSAVAAPEKSEGESAVVLEEPKTGLLLEPEAVVFSGPEGEIKVKDYERLSGELRFLETQAAVQGEELEKLRQESGEVITMTPERVTFASGERVGIGQKVKRSGKADVYVTTINFRRREVLLSDGSVVGLRMSKPRNSGVFARLSGGEPGSSSRGDRGDRTSGREPVDFNGGGGYAYAGNDEGAFSGNGSLGDMGGGIRSGAGEPGSREPAPGSGNGAYSEAPGGGAVEGRQPILPGPVDARGSSGDGGAGRAVGQGNSDRSSRYSGNASGGGVGEP